MTTQQVSQQVRFRPEDHATLSTSLTSHFLVVALVSFQCHGVSEHSTTLLTILTCGINLKGNIVVSGEDSQKLFVM